MKKANIKVYLIFLLTTLFSSIVLGLNGDIFMTPREAEWKWGKVDFNAEKFKAGNSKARASMGFSLVTTKALVGMPLVDVYKRLGPSTGYYFSELIPAYVIGDLSNGRNETWQIILIPDDESKVIEEIKIHKKCCVKP